MLTPHLSCLEDHFKCRSEIWTKYRRFLDTAVAGSHLFTGSAVSLAGRKILWWIGFRVMIYKILVALSVLALVAQNLCKIKKIRTVQSLTRPASFIQLATLRFFG